MKEEVEGDANLLWWERKKKLGFQWDLFLLSFTWTTYQILC